MRETVSCNHAKNTFLDLVQLYQYMPIPHTSLPYNTRHPARNNRYEPKALTQSKHYTYKYQKLFLAGSCLIEWVYIYLQVLF